jgi:hypothetical protein
MGASTRKQAKNPTIQHKHSRKTNEAQHKRVMHKIQLALVQNNQQPAFPHNQVQECTKYHHQKRTESAQQMVRPPDPPEPEPTYNFTLA